MRRDAVERLSTVELVLAGHLGGVGQQPDQRQALLDGERIELERGGAADAAAPLWAGVQQFRAADADHHHLGVDDAADDVHDQVQQDGLRPLQVVQDQNQRPRPAERLDQAPERPGDFVGTDGGRAGRIQVQRGRQRGQRATVHIGLSLQYRDSLAPPAGKRPDQIGDRPVRETGAVRLAGGRQDQRVGERAVGEEFLDQPGLADAGRADHGHQAAAPAATDPAVDLPQMVEFHGAADERRTPGPTGRLVDADEPVRGYRRALSLQRQRWYRLRVHRRTTELHRRGTDEYLADPRGRLQAGGSVHHVADDPRAAGGRLRDDHGLAGVEPAADPQHEPEIPVQPDVQLDECLDDVPGRADGAQRVVIVGGAGPEDRHHRIADELLNDPLMLLDRRAARVVVAVHGGVYRLGVHGLRHRGRADQVAEEHGDDAPARGLAGRGDRGTARRAEACLRGNPGPAEGAAARTAHSSFSSWPSTSPDAAARRSRTELRTSTSCSVSSASTARCVAGSRSTGWFASRRACSASKVMPTVPSHSAVRRLKQTWPCTAAGGHVPWPSTPSA